MAAMLVKIPEQQGEIVVTTYPLEFLARRIGGDAITVMNMTADGASPHTFEPTPQDVRTAYAADLFIYSGSGVDPFAEGLAEELVADGVRVIAITGETPLADHLLQDADDNPDPHFWLDPRLMIEAAEILTLHMQTVWPDEQQTFHDNLSELKADLQELDTELENGLSSCTEHTIIVSHDAFSYFTERYGLTLYAIAGISPEQEVSPQWLAELTEIIREKQVRYIFTETLISPRLAETLAREAGVGTLILNPSDGLTAAERQAGTDYPAVMRGNLENLSLALACK